MVMVDGHCRGKIVVSRQNKDTFQIAKFLTKIEFLCFWFFGRFVKMCKANAKLKSHSLNS